MTKTSSQCELAALAKRIRQRRDADSQHSYTAQLLQGDEDTLLKKIIEEAGEAALAARSNDSNRLAEELADLCFHCFVVMERYNISMERIVEILKKRSSQSGVAEKAARKEK